MEAAARYSSQIWSLGLGLDAISEEHVVLYCPRL